MWARKGQTLRAWLIMWFGGGELCCLREHRDFLGGVFREFQCGGLNPSWRTTERILQEFIREFSHWNLAVFGLVVEDGDKEPAELRRIMPWS